MPDLLTAKCSTFLKADPKSHSSALADADKLAIAQGAVIEAPAIMEEKGHFVVRGARLNGQPVPGHLIYAHASHWSRSSAAPDPGAGWEARKPQVMALLAEGRSVSSIAKELRIGRAFIKRWRDGA
ncbi:helix-turn-helix domain-containing protein [Falsiroseomonas tokyonensis]|uniref:Helix-turn-helix domain-containing protein n=1 Tax=Falsiroseomonas tokyonensis TaxID=430521 RepID=A0ABV7BRL8_9PROT|nr:helix-turn-helix domain-containing protein [Falsiroseomonas tokyonensis]MBU8537853.1 helix-turn-helix domain-containing protein [Falsiroseomonas tokyonensis]